MNIVPNAKLEKNKYILEIPAKAIKDVSGNYLQNKYVLKFTIKSNLENNKPSEPTPTPTPEPTPKVAFYCDFEPDSPGMTWEAIIWVLINLLSKYNLLQLQKQVLVVINLEINLEYIE